MMKKLYAAFVGNILFLLAMVSLYSETPAQSSPEEIHFKPQLLFLDNNEACAIADINLDGLPDITAGRNWYAAPDFVPQPIRHLPMHGPEYAQNNGEHALDVDQDGYTDVITTGWENPNIRWYKNPGPDGLRKGLLWKEAILANTQNTRSEAGYLVDLNADGQPEYIMNSWNQETAFTVWRLEKNVFGEPIMKGSMIGPRNSHGVGFGDVNGDGRTDILFDHGWYEQPEKNIWRGNWTLHNDFEMGHASCPVQLVDLTGNGRNDIIWGRGHGYGLYWLEQNEPKGDTTTWTRHIIDESWSQVHAMLWTDLDGNGQEELIVGKRIFAHNGRDPGAHDTAFLYRYVWDASRKSFHRHLISKGNIGTGLFIRAADLNQDGKQDLVVAGKTGTYILWQE